MKTSRSIRNMVLIYAFDGLNDIHALDYQTIDNKTYELLTHEVLSNYKDLFIDNINIRISLDNWKSNKAKNFNDLSDYNIINITSGSGSKFIKSFTINISSEINKILLKPVKKEYLEIKNLILEILRYATLKER
ncbi:19027_t:CDS:2 [Entrophospora sp. SA101]|nr:19027_t:CDS:2 [Entrophospora sp. SA101]